MNGSDLAYLAGTADLADLEFASPRLTLHTEKDRFIAQYAGAYSSGLRWIHRDHSIPNIDIDIESDKFKHIAGTFPANTAVSLSVSGTSLRFRAKNSNHQLRSYPATERIEPPTDIDPLATLDARTLLTEVELAADLNKRNTSNHGAIGLHITVNKAKHYLRLMSYNGHSALFVAQVDCDDVVKDQSIVVPAKDFASGLGLFEEGVLEIGISAGRLTLRSDGAYFTCPTENVTWPNFTGMLKKTDSSKISFPVDVVKNASNSAKKLGASNLLEVSGTERGVVMRTLDSEAGSFAVAVEGALEGTYYFGTDDLLFASKIVDEELTLELAQKKPAMIREKRRLLVLQTQVI